MKMTFGTGSLTAKKAFLTTIITYVILTFSIHIHNDQFIHQLLNNQSVSRFAPSAKTFSSQNVQDNEDYVYNVSHLTLSQKKYCDTFGPKSFNSSLFKKILYNDEYKIVYCSVPKIACTNWARMFLILSGKMNTTNPIGLPLNDVHGKYLKYLTRLSDLPVDEIKYRLGNYYKFLFTREPLERVLSAYRDKLKAHNPYFHSRFGMKIAKRYRLQSKNASLRGNDVTFREFVQYLTDFTRKEPANEHWEKITNLCHPCLVKYDFIGTMDNIKAESDDILEKIGALDIVKFPQRSAAYKRPKTKTFLRRFYSRLSPAMLDQLLEMYYPDFLMFNMTIPVALRNLTKWIVKM